MPIIEPAIRPPAEAFSFLLQVTLGCSSNNCTFCGAYKGKPFSIKPLSEIITDIEIERRDEADTRKIFLMDGNALVLPNKTLVSILQKLHETFPKLTRISSYANGEDIARRNQEELKELADLKLNLIYLGLESGSQEILDDCHKKTSVSQMVEAVNKAETAGIKSSVMVLLGLGGIKNSRLHIEKTSLALNQMQPKLLSFLSLMLIPGTELYKAAKKGEFQELNSRELLVEARDILAGLDLKQTVFRCNHASNYLSLEGRLPQDKVKLLRQINAALLGKTNLKPEFLRGL